MTQLPPSQREAAARRERYIELRRQGVEKVTAAIEAGVCDTGSQARYERWFQAAETGQEMLPEHPGRRP